MASPCQGADDILVPNPGDEYFVAMCSLSKGRRLLRRATPLLVPEYARELFCTVFRNIGVLQWEKAPVSKTEDAVTMAFFMTLAHTLVQLGAIGAGATTHASLIRSLTQRYGAYACADSSILRVLCCSACARIMEAPGLCPVSFCPARLRCGHL